MFERQLIFLDVVPSIVNPVIKLHSLTFKAQQTFFVAAKQQKKRFCPSSSRTLGREQKKKQNDGVGGGERRKRLPANPTILKNAFDWCCAGSVDYLALETSIIADMFCLRASQIWSDPICGRRLQMLWSDIYLNHVCAKVYQI